MLVFLQVYTLVFILYLLLVVGLLRVTYLLAMLLMASGFAVGDVSGSVIVCGNVPMVVAGGGCVGDG